MDVSKSIDVMWKASNLNCEKIRAFGWKYLSWMCFSVENRIFPSKRRVDLGLSIMNPVLSWQCSAAGGCVRWDDGNSTLLMEMWLLEQPAQSGAWMFHLKGSHALKYRIVSALPIPNAYNHRVAHCLVFIGGCYLLHTKMKQNSSNKGSSLCVCK